MIQNVFRSQRGMALLLVLAIMAILVATVFSLNATIRSSLVSTAAARDRITLTHMASSGIHCAMAMLVKDKSDSDTDSLQEDWANPEKISELLLSIPFEAGKLHVTITDELSRIQANALVRFPEGREMNESQRLLWERFLGFFFEQDDMLASESDPLTIINSLKDWIDSGDDDAITGLSGAETDYYEALSPPYPCRNGPLPHLGELLLVNGVTERLFYGTDLLPGISGYLTVEGAQEAGNNSFTYAGKININTAELPVIAALLPPESAELAEAIFNYRMDVSDDAYIHELSNPTWYKNVPGCSDIDIDANLIQTSTDLFRITATAMLPGMQIMTTAIVERERNQNTGQWTCLVLRWEST